MHEVGTCSLNSAVLACPQCHLDKEIDQRSSMFFTIMIAGIRISTGWQYILSMIGEIEGGRIRFGELVLQHPLLDVRALTQLIASHYTGALLPELFKLLGSASLLGKNPCLFKCISALSSKDADL